MKTLVGSLLAGAVVIALSGCSKESGPGGPGAAKKTTPTTPGQPIERSYQSVERKETFSLSAPSTETSIKKGDKQEVTIAIKRGSDFNEPVTLKFNASAGLTITPTEVVMKPTDKDARILIEAAEDAPLGKANIDVTGMPETGKAVSVALPVEIKERG